MVFLWEEGNLDTATEEESCENESDCNSATTSQGMPGATRC